MQIAAVSAAQSRIFKVRFMFIILSG